MSSLNFSPFCPYVDSTLLFKKKKKSPKEKILPMKTITATKSSS